MGILLVPCYKSLFIKLLITKDEYTLIEQSATAIEQTVLLEQSIVKCNLGFIVYASVSYLLYLPIKN